MRLRLLVPKKIRRKLRLAPDFNNFITQHYMRQSDVPAVEFNPDPTKTQMSQKDPSRPTQMNVVMDTMSRVGGHTNEFVQDGKWGPRTNAALKNAYALAYGLLQMARDFKYTPRSFDQTQLTQLKDLVPPQHDQVSFNQEDTERAQQIAPDLRKIRMLFAEVKNHILNKTGYRSYVEGSQPFITYQKGQAPTSAMIEQLNSKFANMTVTGAGADGQTQTRPITVGDLASVQALQLWQQKNLPTIPLENIIAQLKKHLDESDVSQGAT